MVTWMYYLLAALFLPLLILTIVVQVRINSVYSKYKTVESSSGITAKECARKMLDAKGLSNVQINECRGELNDNYNPKTKTVNISASSMNSSSISAIAVCAHEVGHAYQDADPSYLPMKLRAIILPLANIGSKLVVPVFLVGLILMIFMAASPLPVALLWIAVGLYFLSTLFYLITLPIELNASKRALATIEANGFLSEDEMPCAKSLLNAAAWTYIAGLLTSLFYFLRFLLQVLVITRRD